ncbi:hypothetical protein LMG28614_06941 [Paraburkholderia ultramafica]|uniref:Uncharacterized protein n=1 Tax=Paraburkholderia ultramafica TaxID=1544867 RepID=A0A6S7D6Z4_9BURK|nr:hypothetical protein LMG28614_06941 [Paraburkholderia ultramafica]
MFSPSSLLKIVSRWTARIRNCVKPEHARHAYIFVTHEGAVRGYRTGEYDGIDSDQVWLQAERKFKSKYNLPPITLRQVRATGLDMVREVTGDDILAVQAAGGQQAQTTIDIYYRGAPAKRRGEEKLLKVMIAYSRWACTGGYPDVRGFPEAADVLAATPGWMCFDPFDSPIPGEIEGRACQAFGRCPACEFAFVDITSPYALARLIQLADELKAARFYLEYPRWKAAYERGLEMLLKRWIPAFKSGDLRKRASRIELGPIGRVE